MINTVPIVKRRRKRRCLINFFKYFSYTILSLFLIFIILGGSSWLNLYRTYNSALAGRNNLKTAIELAQSNDFKKALSQAEAGEANFNLASSQLALVQNNFLLLEFQA